MAHDNNTSTIEEQEHEVFPMRYLIVRPENGGVRDLFRFMAWGDRASGLRFLESSEDNLLGAVVGEEVWGGDHRWVIVVSILVRKLIALFGKPMEWTGYIVDFLLNLLYLNGNFLGLFYNLIHGTLYHYHLVEFLYVLAVFVFSKVRPVLIWNAVTIIFVLLLCFVAQNRICLFLCDCSFL